MRLDLREWLVAVDGLGQLARIDGAEWDLEIGAITEASIRRLNGGPAILFDHIPGAPPGFRVLTNSNASIRAFSAEVSARLARCRALSCCMTSSRARCSSSARGDFKLGIGSFRFGKRVP